MLIFHIEVCVTSMFPLSVSVLRTCFKHTHTHRQADVSQSVLTDTCPLPNCRFIKSAGCGCQAVSKWMPSGCRDSRSQPSCNCRDDAISPAHLVCTSVPTHNCLTAKAHGWNKSNYIRTRVGLLLSGPLRFSLHIFPSLNNWYMLPA